MVQSPRARAAGTGSRPHVPRGPGLSGPAEPEISMPGQARPVWVIRAAAVPSGCRSQTGTDPAGDAQLRAVTDAASGSPSQPEHRNLAGHDDAGDNEHDGRGVICEHTPDCPQAARGAHYRSGAAVETVTQRQPQARAGQVVRADRTAPYAMPPRRLTRPTRRDLRTFPEGRGISNPVRGGLPGHRALQLTPLRNSASTSARRYRGRPASLRTSGSRPRRAQVATAAEVTPNRDATCLRVIRSSPMQLPAIATTAGPRAADVARAQPGRTGGGTITFIGVPS